MNKIAGYIFLLCSSIAFGHNVKIEESIPFCDAIIRGLFTNQEQNGENVVGLLSGGNILRSISPDQLSDVNVKLPIKESENIKKKEYIWVIQSDTKTEETAVHWGIPYEVELESEILAVYDDIYYDDSTKSEDIKEDMKYMWHTTPRTSGYKGEASSMKAVRAAKRVFNTIDILGYNKKEVIELLGDPKSSSESVYNFPFFPAGDNVLVYRFDTGNGGWQFNIKFIDGQVESVKHLGIH
ncbi:MULTISPECIES: hypothetical protein [unclassified Lentimonas]|uniref:hypothetical protein n=1 Tax=unclassified Lentimonas TaxID=2630993 RepID=UPI0013291288|nr:MULTISPECIES: hypothetical protein [unclassified Lentimonas]CAA6677875.1 Unannotated [Lentimonas sp. CC4]CAA6683979.1 Unannotated [Lentimonas sp. CC6]CAA7076645.1 Unannotated [Lentimonas sp. CC4]CAA7170027.1 Unannotated [Lentimonas sp. CC21]CAA7181310.1 Unannotated [Lentimonas sp. CC8]